MIVSCRSTPSASWPSWLDRKARGLPLAAARLQIPGGVKGEQKAISLTKDLFIPLAKRVETSGRNPAIRARKSSSGCVSSNISGRLPHRANRSRPETGSSRCARRPIGTRSFGRGPARSAVLNRVLGALGSRD